jgi:alpha-D-ribose 1-methylphosphonate 5-triphosphate diphosphatase PhnM
VTLASRNPARAGRINGRQRGLVPGERADIVRFQFRDGAVRILETWCGGRKVYTAAAN